MLASHKFGREGMLRLKASRRASLSPVSAPPVSKFWAAGFNFSRSQCLREVPYPRVENLFFGEEALMAAKLWTAGWDFFAPPEEVVHHLWSRKV